MTVYLCIEQQVILDEISIECLICRWCLSCEQMVGMCDECTPTEVGNEGCSVPICLWVEHVVAVAQALVQE